MSHVIWNCTQLEAANAWALFLQCFGEKNLRYRSIQNPYVADTPRHLLLVVNIPKVLCTFAVKPLEPIGQGFLRLSLGNLSKPWHQRLFKPCLKSLFRLCQVSSIFQDFAKSKQSNLKVNGGFQTTTLLHQLQNLLSSPWITWNLKAICTQRVKSIPS